MKPNRFVTTLGGALTALAFAIPLPAAAQEKVVFGFPAPYNVQSAYLWFGSKLGYFKQENMQLGVIAATVVIAHAAPYMHRRRVCFLEHMPLGGTNKIDRHVLRAHAAVFMQQEAAHV